MKVRVGGWAWTRKDSFTEVQLRSLKAKLTIYPRKVGDHPGEPPSPVYLYREDSDGFVGMPRQYYLANRKPHHEVEFDVTEGRKDLWGGPLKFSGSLREEQRRALVTVSSRFRAGTYGGILRASPGWGKTVWGIALAAEMQVPTLVVVHKEFLMNQWRERIEQFMPGAKIGYVQEDTCDFQGKHFALAMVHSLSGRDYGPVFYDWPGLVITDETHRIGAATWALVPPKFRARWRLGITATPRRKDGADNVFYYHIGEILFTASEQRMKPKVRRVWTDFKLIKTATLNPSLIPKSLLLKFMCANKSRNKAIVKQLVLALNAGRKVLVLSERLAHLTAMEFELKEQWKDEGEKLPSIGYYVGGMTEDALEVAAKARVIFATRQFAEEGLDIPALDTLLLTTPMSDVEQAVGRILRPFEGKKEPVVVDFRDDNISYCMKMGESRDKFYKRVA